MSCGIDISEFPEAKKSIFGGEIIADGHPPPVVSINENIESGNCSGFNAEKAVTININGELVCCDPEGKLDAKDELLEQFSVACGDFEVDGHTFENCRVQNVDVSSSHYRDNVPYSISLLWVDPDFPEDGNGEVDNPQSSIQASEDDERVTITHTVSAVAAANTPCEEDEECGCELDGVIAWVESEISDEVPLPKTISLPDNPEGDGANCYDEDIEQDDANCSYSISRTWTLLKKPAKLDAEDYGNNIVVKKCRTNTENSRFKDGEYITETTLSYNGNVSWEGSARCEEDCDKALGEVKQVLNKIVDDILGTVDREPSTLSVTTTDSRPPSGNYSITFNPPADEDPDSPEGINDERNVSVSMGEDGIITVVASGTLGIDGSYRLRTEDCRSKCEIINDAWDASKYPAIAKKVYNSFRSALGTELLEKLQGECSETPVLNPEPTSSSFSQDEDTCEINYSYTFTDAVEQSEHEGWSYTVTVTKPIDSVSISPLLNGGFCVIRGAKKEGTINVSGQREQSCEDDPEFDLDKEAFRIASGILPGEDLREEDTGCTTTRNGDDRTTSFNKTYKYGGGFGGAQAGISVTQLGGGAPDEF